MSITNAGGEYMLACDNYCGATVMLNSWDEALEYKKSNGWKSKKRKRQMD